MRVGQGKRKPLRTPDKDIKNQYDETDNATAGAVLPWVSGSCAKLVASDGGGEGESREPELEEGNNSGRHHFDRLSFATVTWWKT